ncbi:MAG TPA: ComEC/Rec2 family competence protein, partial [Novosphingobium sp.]|nr:ComEC/Rec2 family competence protein [Novosphingobium sp.]
LLLACGGASLAVLGAARAEGEHPQTRRAALAVALLVAAGMLTVWAKSALVGAPPIERPMVTTLTGRIVEREERGAEDRVRLVLEARGVEGRDRVRVRVNLPAKADNPGLAEGAVIRLKARLMPPAPPMLPGAYDFARAAWFQGLAATGGVLGKPQVLEPADGGAWLGRVQRSLAAHVRARLAGSPGAIAAAFASGDRGAIAPADDDAMRDAGLTHLLSVSGLHLSAVVGAAYFLAIRLLALWPWLTLRVRLPLVAAGVGAFAGIGYTLLTGAEVPTVRSCIGAVLVLAALALGRDPLSMRMVAVAAFFVMLFWPEAVVGPSFQMSFAAVIAIVALSASAPVKRFLGPREEGWAPRLGRLLAMLLLTGVVIELALMPIGLFHFHRAGVYGALANVIAIPLTTFVSMPLIALALALDLVGLGAPAWWAAGKSLELLLALAHWTASRPDAVAMLPAMADGAFAAFVAGGLWLALWRGRVRLWGLVPVALATLSLANLRSPDVLVSGDGRHVAITGTNGELLVLRQGKSTYASDNLREIAGIEGALVPLATWPGARCSRDACSVTIDRHGRTHTLLLSRNRELIDERALAAACERADIVVSGGLAIDLRAQTVRAVAESRGNHGWERMPAARPFRKSRAYPRQVDTVDTVQDQPKP